MAYRLQFYVCLYGTEYFSESMQSLSQPRNHSPSVELKVSLSWTEQTLRLGCPEWAEYSRSSRHFPLKTFQELSQIGCIKQLLVSSFSSSVRLSLRKEQYYSHRADFHEILCLSLRFVDRNRFCLNSDKLRPFIRRPTFI